MKLRSIISGILVFTLLFALAAPAFAVAPGQAALAVSVGCGTRVKGFFSRLFEKIKALFLPVQYFLEVKKERVPNTMHKNAIHMLKSVQDTIGDSFIITTEDGKVIVIDGGFRFETDYFIQYLKAVTGQRKPKIDAWFLSHPHTDHVELFNEVAEHRTCQVTFDKVLLHYLPAELYASRGEEEGLQMVSEFDRISKAFPEKVQILNTGDVFNIGKAKITVLYTADPSFINVNEHSVIFRMDLGDKSVMFTGDAEVEAGNKTVAQWADSGLLKCDICKMAHHGQNGVDKNFYEAVAPEICLWPMPSWVWDNVNGNLKTLEVRGWIDALGVKENYISKDSSQVLYLD